MIFHELAAAYGWTFEYIQTLSLREVQAALSNIGEARRERNGEIGTIIKSLISGYGLVMGRKVEFSDPVDVPEKELTEEQKQEARKIMESALERIAKSRGVDGRTERRPDSPH